MSQAITMPALSDTMSNGRLVKWTRKPGDRIKKGDVIAEVETDKAVMEVEAFQDGYLTGPLAVEGTEAPVGETIGFIAENAGEVAATTSAPRTAEVPQRKDGDGHVNAQGEAAPAPISAVLAASMRSGHAAPRRRMAAPSAELKTAPTSAASPAGAEGAAIKAPAADTFLAVLAAGPPYRIERPSFARAAVARNMMASAATPRFHVTALLQLQPVIEAAAQRQLSFSVLLARACALTIATHPLFNAAYTAEGLAMRERVDIGVAFDNGEGLVTPVLRDAANRSISALSDDWNKMREAATTRRLSPRDYSGATFYLSNLGNFPVVHTFDSIIPVGASAIVSVAAAGPQGANCTLTCDHRVVFGADAAKFLATLEQHLKDPAKLLAS
jgi:pyruvate dehydrogenase E2 component (dihydrolipoamide acetyltransferase)